MAPTHVPDSSFTQMSLVCTYVQRGVCEDTNTFNVLMGKGVRLNDGKNEQHACANGFVVL